MGRGALVVFFILAACGDDPGGGDDEIDRRPYCEREDGPYEGIRAVFAEYCSAIERCDLALSNGFAFQCRQECVQAFEFGLTCGLAEEENDRERFARKIEKREVIYDEQKGARCIEWLGSIECSEVGGLFSAGVFNSGDDDSDDGSGEQPRESPCQDVFDVIDTRNPPDGSLGLGEVCEDDYDCADGLYCTAPDPGSAAVVCSACAPLPGPGSPCLDYRCGADAYCSPAEPYTCLAKKSAGSTCEYGEECLSKVCYEGGCIDPLPDGQSCAAHLQCASTVCFEGACITQVAEGEACSGDGQCLTGRCYQGACITPGYDSGSCQDHAQCYYSCYRGTCINQREPGEACDETVNCGWNQACYANVCVRADELPDGAPCTQDYECWLDRCVGGVCVNPRENGQPCTDPEQCVWNVCYEGACGLPNGADCDYREQCRSGRCPNYSVCTVPTPDGQACTYHDECESFVCLDGICFTLGEVGDPCARSEECEGEIFCDPDNGRCTMPRLNGERCTADEACYYGHCDLASNTCGYVTGEACTTDWECQGFCDGVACADPMVIGSTCDRDAQCLGYCVNAECVTLKPFFAECVRSEECADGICDRYYSSYRCRGPNNCFEHDDCGEGGYCNEDDWPPVCAPRKADGERCEEDRECTNYCHYSCVAKRPSDSSCTTDDECIGGLCDNGRCSEPGLCYSDGECTNGQICDRPFGYSEGRCTDVKADGLPCQGDEQCISGYCSHADETCKTRPTLGQACLPFECTLDSYCRDGVCQARKRPGSQCDESFYADLECLAPAICRRGVCETISLECEPAPAGRMCTFLMACADDAYCDLLDGFTCKARYQLGQECETVLWRANTCVDGSYCNTVCEAYALPGESCASRSCNFDSYCDPSQTCQPLKYRGEPCESEDECLSESCYDMGDGMRCDGPCKPPG